MKSTFFRLPGNAFFLLSLFLTMSACKKDTTKTILPPQTSPCKLTDMESTIFGRYKHFWYAYDKNGKLDSVYRSDIPGPKNSYIGYCKMEDGGYIWYDFNYAVEGKPANYVFSYSNGFGDSSNLPGSLATSFSDHDKPAVEITGYGYSFSYKPNGRLSGYKQTASEAAAILSGLSIDYTSAGDVQTLQFYVITGPKGQQIATTNGFDDHPTPYAGLPGWVFQNPDSGWGGSEFDALLFGVSDHNPLQWVFRDNDNNETLREDMTYEYNDHGQPTVRHAERTVPGGAPQSYTERFTYDCN